MRPLVRPALSANAQGYLEDCTSRIAAADAADKVAAAKSQWKQAKKTAHFGEIREVMAGMARGRVRCMYCEDNQGTDIDHFEPIDRNPDKAYTWSNYLLACSYCNSNLKREKFPVDDQGAPLLIDPSADDPFEHLELMIQSAKYGAVSRMGLETIEVFGLNIRPNLVKGRRAALVSAFELICKYAELRAAGSASAERKADLLVEALQSGPFPAVVVTIYRVFEDGGLGLPNELVDALTARPELRSLLLD